MFSCAKVHPYVSISEAQRETKLGLKRGDSLMLLAMKISLLFR